MARILDYPAVKQVNATHWRLLEDLDYKVGNDDSELVTVPKGYITDFASVPKLFWNVLPPFGKYSPAAVIHDFLYGIQGKYENRNYSRKRCDEIFKEAMKVMKVGWLTRGTMYNAVRLFGGIVWNHKKTP